MRKKRTTQKTDLWKNRTSSTKNVAIFFMSYNKNVEVISWGVPGLIFVQITLEKCATIFYFKSSEAGIKMTNFYANFQPFLAQNVSGCLIVLCSLVFNKNLFL